MSEFCMDKLNCLVDLHLHLDGAISLKNACQLAELQGIALPGEDELRKMMMVEPDCRDLTQFLEKFAFPCSLLMTKEAITASIRQLLAECKAQGVMYAEIRFAPQLQTEKGLTQKEVVQAAIEGLQDAAIPANLILCCMRGTDNRAANLETVAVAKEFLGKGVVCVDLAGAEALFPTADYKDIFEEAAKQGVPCIIHAGEADGPESVRAALSFGARRIGHGVHSQSDPALVEELAEKKIPLELCPTSNLQTQAFASLAEYPLRKFMAAGIPLTINTDDPAIEGTELKNEFKLLQKEFFLTKEEIRSFLETSVQVSFAAEDLKKELLRKIAADFAEA